MAQQSVFEKKYVEKDTMSDVEGVLEHFNLPTNVISFIRKHVRAIQIGIAIVVIFVVAFSLYGSYRDKKITNASNALTLALEEASENRVTALQAVVDEYSGTDSALWAQVEVANQQMLASEFDKAQAGYNAIVSETKEDNPLYPLSLFGQAQALESLKKYDEARAVYMKMKDVAGYKEIAYFGIGRTYEAQGDISTAIKTYDEYILSIVEGETQAKKLAEAKVVRLKAQKQ